jgi:hypothetical protein
MFEPHDNTALYEAHIPEAKLTYNSTNNTFHKKRLVDTSAMVMSPVDIINPDLEVSKFIYILYFCILAQMQIQAILPEGVTKFDKG